MDDVNVCLILSLYLCTFVCLWTLCCLFCTVLSCLCLVLSPGSTLSAQSVPAMYPGQLALLSPGGLADSCSNTLLQPLKPCPSSNNLCSAYTSEGALSVPSLCAPTPGRRVVENCLMHHPYTHKCMHFGAQPVRTRHPRHLVSIFLHQYLCV